jgi:hypothetical protein
MPKAVRWAEADRRPFRERGPPGPWNHAKQRAVNRRASKPEFYSYWAPEGATCSGFNERMVRCGQRAVVAVPVGSLGTAFLCERHRSCVPGILRPGFGA